MRLRTSPATSPARSVSSAADRRCSSGTRSARAMRWRRACGSRSSSRRSSRSSSRRTSSRRCSTRSTRASAVVTGCSTARRRSRHTSPIAIRDCPRTQSSAVRDTGTSRPTTAGARSPIRRRCDRPRAGCARTSSPRSARSASRRSSYAAPTAGSCRPRPGQKTKTLRPDLPAIEVADADHYAPEEVYGPIAGEIGRFWSSLERGR